MSVLGFFLFVLWVFVRASTQKFTDHNPIEFCFLKIFIVEFIIKNLKFFCFSKHQRKNL